MGANCNCAVARESPEWICLAARSCVEKIYGDHGIDVVDLLKKNPAVAIPVVLARLQQKDDEVRPQLGLHISPRP